MQPVAIVVALAAGAGACGPRSDGEQPEPALATTLEAQRAFGPTMRKWQSGTRAERLALESELARLSREYADQDVSRWSDALLACIALERGDLGRARQHAARVVERGPGVTADLGRIVEGAIRRREGHAADALAKLAPLVGKVIDAYARQLLDEEVVAAAVASGRWSEALRYARIWLHEAEPPEQEAAAARLEGLLRKAPPADLIGFLSRASEGWSDPPRFREIVVKRLSTAARDAGDKALARLLMDRAPTLLGEDYDALAELSSGVKTARVAPRTLGLMVSVRDATSRRISAELGLGVAFALGLPTSASRVRLVSRDDRGSEEGLSNGLGALVTEGAAIVLVWADQKGADLASAFAAATEVPIVLLGEPPTARTSAQVFQVGEDRSRTLVVLEKELRVQVPIAPLVVGLDPMVDESTICAQPPRARSILVMGTPWCARSLLPQAAPGTTWAFGMSAWSPGLPKGVLVASAGIFPIDSRTTNSDVGRWVDQFGSPPTWFAALGRDAALLAAQALEQLSDVETEDPNEVASRRRQAAVALASATGSLWTTEASGFGGGRVLPRAVGVKRVD